jgi:hypothetical protein
MVASLPRSSLSLVLALLLLSKNVNDLLASLPVMISALLCQLLLIFSPLKVLLLLHHRTTFLLDAHTYGVVEQRPTTPGRVVSPSPSDDDNGFYI